MFFVNSVKIDDDGEVAYGRDNTRRMVNEAAKIEGNDGIVMNSRNEYKQSCLPRVRVHRNTID